MTTTQHIDVKLAAKFADMPVDEFKSLNPAHNQPVINADGSETIVLPRDKVQTFLTNLENHDQPLVSWQTYTVKAGEKPQKIAARYGISLAHLEEVNGIHGRKKFATGLALLVPVKGDAEPNLPDLPATRVSLPKALKAARYAKRHGVTRKVAQQHHVTRKKTVAAKRSSGKRVKVTRARQRQERQDREKGPRRPERSVTGQWFVRS